MKKRTWLKVICIHMIALNKCVLITTFKTFSSHYYFSFRHEPAEGGAVLSSVSSIITSQTIDRTLLHSTSIPKFWLNIIFLSFSFPYSLILQTSWKSYFYLDVDEEWALQHMITIWCFFLQGLKEKNVSIKSIEFNIKVLIWIDSRMYSLQQLFCILT